MQPHWDVHVIQMPHAGLKRKVTFFSATNIQNSLLGPAFKRCYPWKSFIIFHTCLAKCEQTNSLMESQVILT